MPAWNAAAVLPVAAAMLAVWASRALLLPPPPNVCGTPGGPPVVSPRVRLSDGRHLAYKEWGVPRLEARHRAVLVHGLDASKETPLGFSQELVGELGLYIVSFDRPGFGESDPHPSRSVKSVVMDIQELADHLDLGDRFYLMGSSMGGYVIWGCIKHIPHRLAGVAVAVPVINYWWPSLPANLSKAAYAKLHPSDRRAFWVARHAPYLFYAYMTQKFLMPSALLAGHPAVYNRHDKEILKTQEANPPPNKSRVQGVHESLYRDLMVAFSDWGFEPMDLPNPFPRNEGSVHLWQGGEDRVLDPDVQRYIAAKLPWIRYHECSDCGHLFELTERWGNALLTELLPGEEPKPSAA